MLIPVAIWQCTYHQLKYSSFNRSKKTPPKNKSRRLFFEMLLLEIRGKTFSHASFKKNKERKRKKQTLLREIDLLEKTPHITNNNLGQL